jgi:hypothetical protein
MFAWVYRDDRGEEVGRSQRFADREAAEGWMGDAWADLRERGVEEVDLLDEERDRRLYRMSLDEVA